MSSSSVSAYKGKRMPQMSSAFFLDTDLSSLAKHTAWRRGFSSFTSSEMLRVPADGFDSGSTTAWRGKHLPEPSILVGTHNRELDVLAVASGC